MIGQIADLLWVVLAALALIFGYLRRRELAAVFSTVKRGFEFTFRDVLAEAVSTKAPPDTVTAVSFGAQRAQRR